MKFLFSIFIFHSLLIGVVIADDQAETASITSLSGPYLGQKPPSDTPVIFAPGIVSTGKEHSAAMFTPDGDEVWFGRLFPAVIYYMKKSEGKWTWPRVADFCDTSTTSLYPVLSIDGKSVFFSSDRPIKQCEKELPRGDYHLWMVERDTGQWSKPRHLEMKINFGRRQSCGSVAENGDLYFASLVDGMSMNLFYSKLNDGTYDNPQEFSELNSPSPDHSSFIAADESYMIFSSFRGGFGRSDLFISFHLNDSTWSSPRNLGSEINSAYKDEYPYVTPDGKYLFFNSNRPSELNQRPIEDGPGNIFWVTTSIIEELREAILDEN